MSQSTDPKIYLAGPDVFYPDVEARYAHLEALCGIRGLVGVRPSDGGMSALHAGHGLTPYTLASRICEANIEHIRNCDAVVANMSPFRGAVEPDSGTVFEIGMAVALGKPVAVYLPQANEDMASRIREHFGDLPMAGNPGLRVDGKYGAMVEDFGLPLNLMIACSATIHVSPAEALDSLAKSLDSVLQARKAGDFHRQLGIGRELRA